MYYSTSETGSEGQSWQVHKFHCLSVDHSVKRMQHCCFFCLSIVVYEVHIFLGLCCCSGAGTRSWCSLGTTCLLYISFSLNIVQKILGFFHLGCCFCSWLRSSLWLQFKALPDCCWGCISCVKISEHGFCFASFCLERVSNTAKCTSRCCTAVDGALLGDHERQQ